MREEDGWTAVAASALWRPRRSWLLRPSVRGGRRIRERRRGRRRRRGTNDFESQGTGRGEVGVALNNK